MKFFTKKTSVRWYPIPSPLSRHFVELHDAARMSPENSLAHFDLHEFIHHNVPTCRDRSWTVRFITPNNPGIEVAE